MPHRPLIPVLFSFVGGILAVRLCSASLWILSPFLALLMIATLVGSVCLRPSLRFFALLVSFLMAGALLGRAESIRSRLGQIVSEHRRGTLEGTVLEPSRTTKGVVRTRVRATRFIRSASSGQNESINEDILVSVYNQGATFLPGQRLRFPARLRPFKNFNNPGCYDYESAMKRKGLSCAASVSDGRHVVPMGTGPLPFPLSHLEPLRGPLRKFFSNRLPGRNGALIRALILGERQGISRELREAFNRTGLGHVLAVSGLHVGLVAWMSFFLFKALLLHSYSLSLRTDIRKLSAFFTVIPVVVYSLLAGFQLSSQRAMIMVLVYLFSLVLGQEKDTWSTLFLAGFVISAVTPNALFSPSFHLSFAAVVGILWLTPMIFSRIRRPSYENAHAKIQSNPLVLYAIGLFAASISAMVFLVPIQAYYFHRINLFSILANLTVIPVLGFWVIPAGLLSSLAYPLLKPLASLFLHTAGWGLQTMMGLISFWSKLSFLTFRVVTPNLFEIVLYYALIMCLLLAKGRKWTKLGAVLVSCFILLDLGYWVYNVHFHTDLRVTYLDVGQGSSALLEFPGGRRMLIDGGGFSRDFFDTGEMVVAPFLWYSKISRIDYVVLSHPQSDHMNGLRFIVREFHPKEFWYNGDQVDTVSFKELMQIVRSSKVKIFLPCDLKKGRMIGGAKIEVLHPRFILPPAMDRDFKGKLNNHSLVLKVSFEGISMLFPGDIEKDAEKALVSRSGALLRSQILLSPHHGSETSNTKEFLEAVSPTLCIISCGEANYAGFPHRVVLKRMKGFGCKVLRIDQTGAVRCTIGSETANVTTALQGRMYTFPKSSLKFGRLSSQVGFETEAQTKANEGRREINARH